MLICFVLDAKCKSQWLRKSKQTNCHTKKSNSENLRRKTAMKLQLHPHPSLLLFSSSIRHRCSCNMTVAHPRDLLRCMGRKTPDFKRIPQGWIYNVKIIYWMASTDKQKLVEFCVWCHSPHMLLSFQLCQTLPIEARRLCQITVIDISHIFDTNCAEFLISIKHLSIFNSRSSWKAAYYFKMKSRIRRDVVMWAI